MIELLNTQQLLEQFPPTIQAMIKEIAKLSAIDSTGEFRVDCESVNPRIIRGVIALAIHDLFKACYNNPAMNLQGILNKTFYCQPYVAYQELIEKSERIIVHAADKEVDTFI